MQETGWEPSPLFRNMSKEMVRVVRLHRPRFETNEVIFWGFRFQISKVVKSGSQISCIVGQKVVCAGEISNSVYIICSGNLSCQISGREVKKLTTGQSFGEMALYFECIYRFFREHEAILGEAGPFEKM